MVSKGEQREITEDIIAEVILDNKMRIGDSPISFEKRIIIAREILDAMGYDNLMNVIYTQKSEIQRLKKANSAT